MNQPNKEYLKFLAYSGVNYFLKNKPNNYFDQYKITERSAKITDNKTLIDIKSIEDLKDYVESTESELKKTANKVVISDGNQNSEIIIIGEAPGKDEDQNGKPFIGLAGKLLNKMLNAININRKDVYVTNVIPWRPPNNRTPTEKEILEYLPYLQKQIEIINPKILLLLGGTAAKAILATPLSLNKLRGMWHSYSTININKKIDVLVSYHPAFLLRSPQYKKEAWEDLKMLQKKIEHE